MRKTHIIGGLLVAMLLVLGACAPTTTPAPTTIKITAAQLYAEYDANEVAADLKYKDKPLEVSGVVTDICATSQITGKPVIFLAKSLDAPFMEGVTVHLCTDQKVKLATLSKGDAVTVVGICEGIDLVRGTDKFGFRGVRLKDCKIVQ